MFFRLPKNTIKNLHFGPFGGGYPPSPPPPLNTASAYVFFIKSSKINKNHTFETLYLSYFYDFHLLPPQAASDDRQVTNE